MTTEGATAGIVHKSGAPSTLSVPGPARIGATPESVATGRRRGTPLNRDPASPPCDYCGGSPHHVVMKGGRLIEMVCPFCEGVLDALW